MTSTHSLDFPACIGPFTMSSARVATAVNSFYRQHQFPKPDPTSDENSMAGLDPASIALGRGDIMFCQLSPLHPLTLDGETKAAANIPQDATYFAWSYPAVLDSTQLLPHTASAEKAFLEYGGYIYFNDARDAVGTNSITPAPIGTLGLMFGRPQPLAVEAVESLTRQGRFQEITLESLARAGATHFAWIRPSEFSENTACPDGAFAYKFRGGCARYFPVVQQAIFSKELLDEELEQGEAWVVVRNAEGPPNVEQIALFDRSESFKDNLLKTAAHTGEVANPHTSSLVVTLKRESDSSPEVSYEEWAAGGSQELRQPGAIHDPWIATIHSLPEGLMADIVPC